MQYIYDWMIIIAEIIMFLACCMFGNSSSNPNRWSVYFFHFLNNHAGRHISIFPDDNVKIHPLK